MDLQFENVIYSVQPEDPPSWNARKAISKVGTSPPRKQILNGITGSAAPGEILAMMGPSGSGKTTLLNILGGRLITNNVTGTITYNSMPYCPALKRRCTSNRLTQVAARCSATCMYNVCIHIRVSLCWAPHMHMALCQITASSEHVALVLLKGSLVSPPLTQDSCLLAKMTLQDWVCHTRRRPLPSFDSQRNACVCCAFEIAKKHVPQTKDQAGGGRFTRTGS